MMSRTCFIARCVSSMRLVSLIMYGCAGLRIDFCRSNSAWSRRKTSLSPRYSELFLNFSSGSALSWVSAGSPDSVRVVIFASATSLVATRRPPPHPALRNILRAAHLKPLALEPDRCCRAADRSAADCAARPVSSAIAIWCYAMKLSMFERRELQAVPPVWRAPLRLSIFRCARS